MRILQFDITGRTNEEIRTKAREIGETWFGLPADRIHFEWTARPLVVKIDDTISVFQAEVTAYVEHPIPGE